MCSSAQIVYNAAYDRYVLLFHADTPKFEFPAVGVAFAKEITGEQLHGALAILSADPWGLGSWIPGTAACNSCRASLAVWVEVACTCKEGCAGKR